MVLWHKSFPKMTTKQRHVLPPVRPHFDAYHLSATGMHSPGNQYQRLTVSTLCGANYLLLELELKREIHMNIVIQKSINYHILRSQDKGECCPFEQLDLITERALNRYINLGRSQNSKREKPVVSKQKDGLLRSIYSTRIPVNNLLYDGENVVTFSDDTPITPSPFNKNHKRSQLSTDNEYLEMEWMPWKIDVVIHSIDPEQELLRLYKMKMKLFSIMESSILIMVITCSIC
ncbi:hypothetical protein G9A89_007375 [Geosiphon pyriformis]|nr:hypothetical protein G9A89_007375 [Geosiphon pyriformis]